MKFQRMFACFTAVCFLWSIAARPDAFAQAAPKVDVNILQERIFSADLGRITGGVSYGANQVVVNIQDLHGHYQTQKNIAAIIEKIDDKYNVGAIYAEGASGRVDMSWLSNSAAGRDAKNKIAQELLLDGRLTGVEYFAFKKNKKNVFGLEDASLHELNIERLNRIYSNEKFYEEMSAKIKNEIAWLSNKYLSADGKNFLKLAQKYNDGKITDYKFYLDMFKYAKRINADPEIYGNVLPIDENEYGELKKIIAINEITSKLKVKNVNAELSQYLSELKNKLSYAQYSEMIKATDDFKDMEALCGYIESYGVDKKKPNLLAFAAAEKLGAQINPTDLFFQEQKLRETITSSLSSSLRETEISFLNMFFYFFESYLKNSLTAKDEKYFMENFKKFSDIYAKYASVDHLKFLNDNFGFLNDYYETNNKRNEIFLKNINKNTPLISGLGARVKSCAQALDGAKEVIIVVSGGYHTRGISELLDSQKISYATITPKISGGLAVSDANYRQIITEQSKFFKEALAPKIGDPLQQFFNVFGAALALKSQNALSSEDFDKTLSGLSEIAKKVPSDKIVVGTDSVFDMLKNAQFTRENINFAVMQLNVLFGQEAVAVQWISDEEALITMPAGETISLTKSSDGKIIKTDSDASVSSQIEFNASDFIEIARNILSKSFDLSSFADINSESTYQTLKKVFSLAVFKYYADFGVDGAIPQIEEKYKNSEIDGIPYELIGRMPEFFQKAALQKQIEKDAQDKTKPALQERFKFLRGLFFSTLKIFLVVFLLFTIAITSACGVNSPFTPEQPTVEEPIVISAENEPIRRTAFEFLQENPLPRSFIGSMDKVTNPYSATIARRGVIIYDMAVLMKALSLYPRENKDLIDRMVNALYTGYNVRTNVDFSYNDVYILPNKDGYFWKILDVSSRWLDDQSLAVTGENAWIAMAMTTVYNAYKGTETGNRAYDIMNDLGRAMLALQLPSGFVVMAPKDYYNYSYAGVDFNKLISIENNISALQAFKFLAQYGASEDRSRYSEAANKLENALINSYDAAGGYFTTGVLPDGSINAAFATDCQTWIILAIGADRLNSYMNDGNFSVNLLKTALRKAGAKNSGGEYIGVDFMASRAGGAIVSFEWTLGFIKAAQEALKFSPDEELRTAITSMKAYIETQQISQGVLPYSNVEEEGVQTGHGWSIIPGMGSLASSAWYLFSDIDQNPFEILVDGGYAAIPREIQTDKTLRQPHIEEYAAEREFSIEAPIYSGGDNWAVGVFDNMAGKTVSAGNIIRLGYEKDSDFASKDSPTFLARMVYDDATIYFTNNAETAKNISGAVLMTKKDGYYEAVAPHSGTLTEFAVDYGQTTTHYKGDLNPTNSGMPKFNSVTVLRPAASQTPIKKAAMSPWLILLGMLGISPVKRIKNGVKVEANIICVSSKNFQTARNKFGSQISEISKNKMSFPAYIADREIFEANADAFSNAGIKTDAGESVYKAYIDGALTFYAAGASAQYLAELLIDEEKIKDYLPIAGNIVIDALIAETDANERLNKGKSISFDYSKNGTPRVYINVDADSGEYGYTLFDQVRAIKQAQAWTYADRFIVFLDKITSVREFNEYVDNIFSKASNGNIIITAALAENLSKEGKLNAILETARNVGINMMVEESAAQDLKKLFDGTYSAENKTITNALDARLAKNKQTVTVIDAQTVNFANALETSKEVTVIYESAIEQYLGGDRAGFAKYAIEIWTAAKSFANAFNRPITPQIAFETARNIDAAKILGFFPDITVEQVKAWYDESVKSDGLLPASFSDNENIFTRYIDRINAQELPDSQKKEAAQNFVVGTFEKLLIAAELKAQGRGAGLKNRNIEKLLGELLAIKHLYPPSAVENEEAIVRDLDNATEKNYIEKIIASLNGGRVGSKTAEKAIELIMAYSRAIEFDKDSLKPDFADTRAISSILSAA
ncbi:MAG: hypothetical protein LBO62_00525 [Endomicrobium sp.]|jgi:hypothetical protein|nr:hypothetical protein [Endomicrobium sp.]